MTKILSKVPYRPVDVRVIELPKRQGPDGYVERDLAVRRVPARY